MNKQDIEKLNDHLSKAKEHLQEIINLFSENPIKYDNAVYRDFLMSIAGGIGYIDNSTSELNTTNDNPSTYSEVEDICDLLDIYK